MQVLPLAAKAGLLGALLCVLAVFLPAAQLTIGGRLTQHRTSASFFELGRSQGAVEHFLKTYRQSTAKKIGAKVLDKVTPRLRGRAQSGAVDVQDALATLDSLRDEDVRTVGTIAAVTLWTLLGLNLALLALLYGVSVRSARLRIAAAALVALLAAAMGAAIYLVLRRVVDEANAELGANLLDLRGGAYLIPIATSLAGLSVLVVVIDFIRLRLRASPA